MGLILIPVFWTKYTATMHGSAVKMVPCENCATEYVYIIEREGAGVGTSVNLVNDEGAQDHAQAAAADTLQSVLDNDYDPVPCPMCGHYQRHMFPKLLGTTGNWLQIGIGAVVLVGCIAAVVALHRSVLYVESSTDPALKKLVAAWVVLLALALIAGALSLLRNRTIRRFNPNMGDPAARIAFGRSRAITRAEFEQGRQEIQIKSTTTPNAETSDRHLEL